MLCRYGVCVLQKKNWCSTVLSKKEKTAMTEETQAYLTKMQVGLLFKNFTASLLKERPEAPLVWLQQYLAENDLDNLVQVLSTE